MKNKIYLAGLVSLSLTVLGGIFKIMHWPGAGIILIIGYVCLCFIFFPFAIRSSFVNDGKKRIGLYIAAFVTLFTDFLGSLFKIMHWPGASWLLIFGITFPVIVFLPVYIYFHVKEKEKSLVNFMYIMFLLVYLGVMSAFLAVRVQKEVLSDAVRVAYISNNDDYYGLKKKAAEGLNHVPEIGPATSELIQYIKGIKTELAMLANDDGSAISEDGSIDFWKIKGKDDFNIPKDFMIGHPEEKIYGKAYELRTKIEAYKNLLVSYSNENMGLRNRIDNILEMKEYSIYDQEVPWEEYYFKYQTITFVLNTLETLQNDVQMAEAEVLGYLSH